VKKRNRGNDEFVCDHPDMHSRIVGWGRYRGFLCGYIYLIKKQHCG